MIDVKKLITGFLILAGASVCSGLILSFINNSPTSAAATPQITLVQNISSTIGTIGANTFLPYEPVETVMDGSVSTTILASSSADPNNLTDVLATAIVNGVDVANPNGPVDDHGLSVISAPNEQSIADQVASMPALSNFTPPDWDIEAGSQPIKVIPNASEQDIANYAQSLSNVVNTGLVASNVQSIVSNTNADASQVSFVESQMQATLSQTLALPTPKPLVAFQKSLVKVMVYEKNELQLADNVGDDPVKASLILQDEQSKYSSAVEELQTNLKNASAINGFAFGGSPQQSENNALAFFNNALGIPTAHAQWLTFDASDFANWIESFVNSIILQILKNTLIGFIQKKVLAWVQGSGAPRFITNWGTTLVNSYEQNAIGAINSQMTCDVFPAFLPQIKLTLGSFYQPNQNSVCANQFQAALGANTFQQFYNHFSNGGFIAYSASQLPSGNPYGGLFFQAQIVDNTAAQAQQAALAQNTASNGLKGDETCDDGSDVNTGEHTVCEDPNGPDTTLLNGSCPAGTTAVVYANAGTLCSDGTQPDISTPGTFTGFGVSSALDGTPDEISAANSIAGLLNAVLSSLLNSLASLAVKSATGALTPGTGITSIPTSTVGVAPTSTIPATVALGCNPLIQTVSSTSPVTLGAVGGSNDAQGNSPTYTWSDSIGDTGTGYIFSPTYNLPGTYVVTINDSSGDPPATCQVIAR